MISRIRGYVDYMFKDVAKNSESATKKEEIIKQAIDCYNCNISNGKSEQEAFNIAVSQIPSIDEITYQKQQIYGVNNVTHQQLIKQQKKSGILLAVSIMLYILCVVPVIILGSVGKYEITGIVLMFVMAAIATGIIIYRAVAVVPNKYVGVEYKEDKHKVRHNPLVRAINSAVWIIIVIAYFIVSFLTNAWYITWIVFLIGAAVTNIIDACFDIRG